MDFHQLLIQKANQHGFPLAGALDLDLAAKAMGSHVARYDEWLTEGRAGAMEYLKRGRDRRADPRLVFPEAKSILCVGVPYSSKPAGKMEVSSGPRYARYLRARDYHKEITERLEALMTEVSQELGSSDPPLRWKACVDTSAVLERSWAALAGLGWIGKNTLLIHPRHGSYFFLGEVLINRETGKGPAPMKDYCGNCTRCLNACPTSALKEPHVLDSRDCISYLTLERRGELPITSRTREAMGAWVAGCDLCQETCPFNLKVSKNPPEAPDGATSIADWRALLIESPEEYRERTRHSSLDRIKPAQFSRNLAIALQNAFLHADEEERSRLSELAPLIRSRIDRESDPIALEEWSRLKPLVRSLTDPQ